MQPIETTPARRMHWTRIWLRRRSASGRQAGFRGVVDAPRLVSSDTSPTRAEWAVTGPTPAARAAAWNRSLTIWGESGTTRSSGTGRAAACSVRRAPATSPFTNRTSRGAGFVLPRRTVTSTPSLAAASATSPQRRALTSLRRSPAMKSSTAALLGRPSSDSTPRPRQRGRWQVARTAARSAATNGCVWPRPRPPAVRR